MLGVCDELFNWIKQMRHNSQKENAFLNLRQCPLGFLVVLQNRTDLQQRFSALSNAADCSFQDLVFFHELNQNTALFLSNIENNTYSCLSCTSSFITKIKGLVFLEGLYCISPAGFHATVINEDHLKLKNVLVILPNCLK